MTVVPHSDGRTLIAKSSLSMGLDINVGLVVDKVLDTSILQDTWTRLIKSSPFLGGVIRSTIDPRQFRCGSTVDFVGRVLDTDLATFLPFSWHGDAKPTLLDGYTADINGKFLFNAGSRRKPVCRLRATILNDGSLLCFSFVHALFDGQSAFDIIHYFCDLLSNKPIPTITLPPDATGTRMSDLIQEPEKSELATILPDEDVWITKASDILKFLRVLFTQQIFDFFNPSERLTDRLIHLPGGWIDEVRARAQKELEAQSEYSGVQLTRNNIVTALYLKMVYTPKKASGDAPIDFMGPINYRTLLDPPAEGTYYAHNSIAVLRCALSERQVQTDSIARVAERLRLATIQYSQPAAVKQEVQAYEGKVLAPAAPTSVPRRGAIKWCCPVVSPWTTFDYADLDFSGAIANGQGRKASVMFVHPDVGLISGSLPSLLMVFLKDRSGGYWLRGLNTASGWEAFDQSVSLETLFHAG